MLFGRNKNKAGMDIKNLRALDKKPVKYVTERDPESYRELKLGDEGAINVGDTEFTVVCGGINVIRCKLTEVNAAELMNKSGLTVKGFDNLLVAGRCISTDRYMQSSVRVMPGCYITGQAAGIAAAVSIDEKTGVHSADAHEIQKRLKRLGAWLPNYKD